MSEDNIELIEIPVNVHLVQDPTGILTTGKSEEDVDNMFIQINEIWSPVKIKFKANVGREVIGFGELKKIFC